MNGRTWILVLALVAAAVAPGCGSVASSSPEVEARQAQIRAEAPGDYWIGRRVAGKRTRFWGFVRRPGQGWEKGQLVVMNERERAVPDRLPEAGSGRVYQFDHNREYRLRGYFSGRQVYDPNSDMILPEFVLREYEEIDAQPGWLFHPRERLDAYGIPKPPR